ncbi:MAG: HEAT repeat domain-containing protein [Planctomycetes bacterium]|nr:HEAT repeat domain-containing protein [Planctomycetota bacterium]
MQEVEVAFCDLCGGSVPAADLESGKAVRKDGRTVGACCIGVLRDAPPPMAGAPVGSGVTAVAGAAQQEGGRLLTVAIVLLVAIATSVVFQIFLQDKVNALAASWQEAQDHAVEKQVSDSNVLMGMDLKLDRAATRADLEAVQGRSGELAASFEVLSGSVGQRLDALQQELTTMRQELRALSDRNVDYRPLFADLRDRHQRIAEAVESLRAIALRAPAAPVVVEPAPPAPVETGGGTLPPELAGLVQKLGAADPAVRFEAVDLLIESKNPDVLPHVLPLCSDADSFVRRLTVEGLREFKHVDAVEALLRVMREDADRDVRDTAWRSLRDVTGEKHPFDADATKEARGRAVQRWQDWWDKAKTNFGR